MKRFLFYTLIIIILLSASAHVIAESNNLALNPGFEEKDETGPYFWTTGSWENNGKFILDTIRFHSERASILVTNDIATDSRYKQQITVKPDTFYKLSCWIMTENVGGDSKGANISIDGLTDTSADIRGTSEDWNYVELYGHSGKEQHSFVLTLGLGGYGSLNTGKAWFDDVSVEELSKVPAEGTIINLYKTDEPAPVSQPSNNKLTLSLVILAVIVAVAMAIRLYFINKKKSKIKHSSAKTVKVNVSPLSQPVYVKMKLDKNDFLIMSVMIFIYLAIAVPNLGSMKAPETYWTPVRQGESVLLDLGKEIKTGRIYYYAGLGQSRPGEGKYRLQYKDVSGNFVPLASIEKTSGNIFIWKYSVTPEVRTRYIKLIVDSPSGTLNEMVIFENNSDKPLKGVKIIENNTDASDEGKVENLFDETDKVDFKHTYLSGMIFDEIYHARTAYEYLNRMPIYEWTHPPLGKLLISIGIAIFGMVPFGWRIIGTLFGAAMVPIMYLFGRKMFEKKFYGFLAALLMMFDFMHFALTRIATIDVYGTFFVILMYYFMYDYFVSKSYVLGFRKSLKPLLLSGICFGLGAASKWIGLYAGGGLAVLFFAVKISEYIDYKKMSGQSKKKAPWYEAFIPLYISRTLLYCVLFFIVIPVAIYIISYIPGIATGSYDGFGYILKNQASMLRYHSKDVLNATHPFSSYWWQWPIMTRPLETYAGSDLASGMSSTMTIMGNPAIWWFGIIAAAIALFTAIRKHDRKMAVVFIAIAFQYLPWVGITRIVFIYHFFSSVPFLILCIVYVFKNLLENYPKLKPMVYIYLGLVMLLFVMFYPVLSGMEVGRSYVEHYLLWFKSMWVF